MIRKLSIPIGAAVVAGFVATGVVMAWLRNTVIGTVGKPSDRNLKTDVTPVHW